MDFIHPWNPRPDPSCLRSRQARSVSRGHSEHLRGVRRARRRDSRPHRRRHTAGRHVGSWFRQLEARIPPELMAGGARLPVAAAARLVACEGLLRRRRLASHTGLLDRHQRRVPESARARVTGPGSARRLRGAIRFFPAIRRTACLSSFRSWRPKSWPPARWTGCT